jgi:hypothetical protein
MYQELIASIVVKLVVALLESDQCPVLAHQALVVMHHLFDPLAFLFLR